MEQQRGGVGVEQLRRLRTNGHKGIGEQQGPTGAVQTGEFLETAQAQIDGTKGLPTQFIPMGKPLLRKHPGTTHWKTQPSQGQG